MLKLACCQSCAHGHLSQHHPSYLFFHTQNKDRCIETPATQPLELHLGFDFASAAVEARALAILKKHCRVDWSGDHGKRIRVGPKVPPSVRWAAVRSWVRARSIAVHWQAQTAHLYAAGGVGRKRDRAAFEEFLCHECADNSRMDRSYSACVCDDLVSELGGTLGAVSARVPRRNLGFHFLSTQPFVLIRL